MVANRVTEIQEQIGALYEELDTIQSECSHPALALKKEANSNTGGYDPSSDSYWYDCHCTLCDKKWQEDQ